jgi:hypothetical protein
MDQLIDNKRWRHVVNLALGGGLALGCDYQQFIEHGVFHGILTFAYN